MREPSPLAAAILTGGRASRMGGLDKSALDIGGLPIVDRQLAVLRQVADVIFHVSSAGAEAGRTIEGLELVHDRFPDHGSLGGIYTAIVESPADRTLVVACDMPFLSAPLLAHMAGVD